MKQELTPVLQYMLDEHITLDPIIWIPAAHDGFTAVETLKDMIDDTYDEDLESIFGFNVNFEENEDGNERDDMWMECFCQELIQFDKHFLVCAAICIREYYEGRGGFRYSMGHANFQWFIVENLEDDLMAKIKPWADERIASYKAKVAKA